MCKYVQSDPFIIKKGAFLRLHNCFQADWFRKLESGDIIQNMDEKLKKERKKKQVLSTAEESKP